MTPVFQRGQGAPPWNVRQGRGRVAISIGRSMCRSWNDPLEARSSRTGRLCLEDRPTAGLDLFKGVRQKL